MSKPTNTVWIVLIFSKKCKKRTNEKEKEKKRKRTRSEGKRGAGIATVQHHNGHRTRKMTVQLSKKDIFTLYYIEFRASTECRFVSFATKFSPSTASVFSFIAIFASFLKYKDDYCVETIHMDRSILMS